MFFLAKEKSKKAIYLSLRSFFLELTWIALEMPPDPKYLTEGGI